MCVGYNIERCELIVLIKMITRFSERRIFRSSIHLHIGGSRSRSIDEQSESLEFHLDPNSKKLVPAPPKTSSKDRIPEFIVKPRRQYINQGGPAKFKTSFGGSQDTELTWSVNGKPVISDGRHKLYKENDCYILEIPSAEPSDQGLYTCKIENSAGSATADVELEVFGRPDKAQEKISKFMAPTVNIGLQDTEFVDREKDATLICKFHNAEDSKAFWFKDNKDLSPWQATASFDGKTAKLVTREASRRTCGVYECVVRNSAGEAKTRCLVTLLNPNLKPVPPKFVRPLTNQTIAVGDKLVFETEITGKPRPTLTWYRDKMELSSTDDVRMDYKDGQGRLIVDNLPQVDAISFSCLAKNYAGEEVSHAKVTIMGCEEREPPIFTKELRDMEVNDGDRVELSVEVKGTPPIDIVWVHNNREIPETDPVCRIVNEGSVQKLVLPEVFPEDSGEYVCEAYNDFGDTDTFCRLTVNEVPEVESAPPHATYSSPEFVRQPQETYSNQEFVTPPQLTYCSPEFVVRPEKVFVNSGYNAVLKCRVSGVPTPSVLWSKGTTIIEHSDKYKISSINDEHFLEIFVCDHEDSGQYTCTLNNIEGTVQVSAAVIVNLTDSPKDLRFLLKKSPAPDRRRTPTTSPTLQSPKLAGDDNQIDFRGILKRSPPKSYNGSRRVNSFYSDSGSDSDRFNNSGSRYGAKPKTQGSKLSQSIPDNTLTDLSSKKQMFEKIARQQQSMGSRRSGYKVNRMLEKFESANSDYQPEKNTSSQSRRENEITLSVSITDRIHKLNSPEKTDMSKLDKTFAKGHSVVTAKSEITTRSEKIDEKKMDRNIAKAQSPKAENQDTAEKKDVYKTEKKLIQTYSPESPKSETVDKSVKTDVSNLDRKFTKTHSLEMSKSENQGRSEIMDVNRMEKKITKALSLESPKFESQYRSEKSDVNKMEKKFVKTQNLVSPKAEKEDQSEKLDKKVSKSPFMESPKSESPDRFKAQEKNAEVPNMMEMTAAFSRVSLDNTSRDGISNQSIKGSSDNQSGGDAIVSHLKPEFQTILKDQSVKCGSEVILECILKDIPVTDVTWEMNNKRVKQSKAFKMSYHDRKPCLVVTEVSSADEGVYKCTVKNASGTATTSCRVSVQEEKAKVPEVSDSEDLEEAFSPTATRPKIYSISPANFCILRGGTIQFKAFFTSVPAARVTWSKNKDIIMSDDRIYTDTSEHCSTLTITEIEPADSGKFTMCVENKLGNDMASACLTVEDVPEAPVGEPWVNDVTLTSVVLSWYGPPYDGGCPITNYRIEACDAEEQEWTSVTNSCLSTSFKIENLSPHTPYFFRIFAENKHGISKPCQTSEVTVTKDRRPSLASRLNSVESDDVFTQETIEVCTPMFEYGIVSPLSPEVHTDEGSNEETDEIPFEHREVKIQSGRNFEHFFDCKEEIGKGKFGSVYKCIEKATGKPWAAKILKCRESEKKKIQLEVEIMNQLKHPKILMLWDVFQAPRKMILVMELIGGGELFERVLDDDFELTERDCIQFMRQILDAVDYMHSKNILHLDLKPENILCIKNESNKIKIIDFGLARFYRPGENVRVLFGTPEFIAPEVVNYDEIGFSTDMWSIGVICYVLLTGLSPFMGDTEAETLANVTQGDFDFDDESFDNVSDDGKHFIEQLLVKNKNKRMKSKDALGHRWLAEDAARLKTSRINTKNLKRFMARRKWQKTGTAIRALGRMASLQKGILSSPNSTGNNSATASPVSSGSSTLTTGSQGTILEDKSESTSFKVSDGEEPEGDATQMDPKSYKVRGPNFANKVPNSTCVTKPAKDINSNIDSVDATNENSTMSGLKISSNENFKSFSNQNSPKNGHMHSPNSRNKFEKSNKLPEFTKEMVDSKAFPGDNVRFDVAFGDTDSKTTATWYFEDDVIHEDSRHIIQNNIQGNSSLVIKNICEDDDGEYVCKIENDYGENSCSAELIVFI